MRAVLLAAAAAASASEKTYVTDLATTCRYGNSSRVTPSPTPRPTASERDQRPASVPMPPLLMRLINNLWS
jgi:hypothetical protein